MNNILHQIDCMEYMKDILDNHFDLAIVDPPYGIDMAEWDTNIPKEEYFIELFRISEKCIIWGGNYYPLPVTEGWLCWNKIHGFKTPLKTMSDFELAWTSFLKKSRIIPISCSGNIINGKVDYNYKPIHPTQKPVALYKWLLTNYAKPGDKLFDSHSGSGSFRIAAYDMGFDLVSCELDADYCRDNEARYQNHIQQIDLFKPEELQKNIFQKELL